MSQNSSSRVVIAGASGFVGSALRESLSGLDWDVISLVRANPKSEREVRWDPAQGEIDPAVLEGADVVINLAGASIAGGWWTEKRKNILLQSRLGATNTLARAIATSKFRPSVFINTSAIGFYGSRPGEVLTEQSSAGDGFLADVCVQWEAAADPAREVGVRVVHPRFGLVMDREGGMLPLIKWPFKFAVGGKIGGDQYMGWVDLHDLVRSFPFLIESSTIDGPVNIVAPNAVTNAEFTKAMGQALNRPTIIPIPKKLAAIAGGELVQDLLLADQHVVPEVLNDAGFVFERSTIDASLAHAFGNPE